MAKKELPEHIKTLLMQMVRSAEREDRAVRERQIRTWRRLKLFWEGFQNVWYSEVAHDWRIWNDTENDNTDQAYYDRPVNIFRAYLESIIAALSVTVPGIKCYPDDADNPLDLATAHAGDKIYQIISRHNEVSLLWLHALFIFMTEGMVACYAYPKEDEKYGTYDENEYEDVTEEHEYLKCPVCQALIQDKIVTPEQLENKEKELDDEFMPEDPQTECPVCESFVTPQSSRESLIIPRLVGVTTKPKTRICLEAYGGLYVKVPNYAKRQEDCPYLLFSYETNYANVLERYPQLHGKIKTTGSHGAYDQYDQWGRLSPQYQGEYPINVVTMKYAWLRPCYYNTLEDENDVKEMKKHFPKGVKVAIVNDLFADAETEVLDDCWTLTHNPLSDYLYHDPLGLLLVTTQELVNDLISLIEQTIEHGISLVFADPNSLNFKAFEQTETTPGAMFPAVAKTGKSLQESFYEVSPARLSGEVLPFFNTVQSLGQMVSGALPSLFGGAASKGSNTASEYAMSRSQALQRLQNVWKIFTSWWKIIYGKVIPMYIKEVKEDERDVQLDESGNFINVLIRKAELEGKIGRVELESAENLPITWSQQKDIIMQLLSSANPQLLQLMMNPENLPFLRDAIGLVDMVIPGEEDRVKQYDEIKLLLQSEPIEEDGLELPSIEPEEIDNHEVHYQTCVKWANSEIGKQSKADNPMGYKNILIHARMHMTMIQAMSQPPVSPEMEKGAPPPEKPNKQSGAPVSGEQNVQI